MQKLVEVMARALVNKPDEVRVNAFESDQTIVLELSVGRGDVGQVIGKQGRNAQAMRTILQAASGKMRRRSVLEIID